MKLSSFTLSLLAIGLGAALRAPVLAQSSTASTALSAAPRQHLPMDKGWKFALGHATDTAKDFGYGTAYFFFAKTGYGDGPAASGFDDRAWRSVNLPHDWAAELPFDRSSNGGHGFKPIGRRFPENSVGWYRKSFSVPQSDFGKRITVQFDGVYRNSEVYLNGFFLGRQPSGYTGMTYDLSAYLNYGGNNVLSVRADASVDEGWFYEGAGIYRHVWLNTSAPLHVAEYGTAVSTAVTGNRADVTAKTTVANDGTSDANFSVRQVVLDSAGRILATGNSKAQLVTPGESGESAVTLRVSNPQLWSLETPTMHRLMTTVMNGQTVIDQTETPFGIRTIRFDPNLGFFLNGQRVQLNGTNNHQDFAGVGTAIPDALQEVRIAKLKGIGCNAYRTSHHPPTPEMLDACDRLGMLVIDEHRMMGTSPEMMEQMKTMILRDRNHPSVIIYSMGNEEWGIEGNQFGERITAQMQAVAKRLDPTRRQTFASSGGWGNGSSKTTDVMGYNYVNHGDSDKYHADFPNVPSIVTEETTPRQSRGVYFPDPSRGHVSAFAPATVTEANAAAGQNAPIFESAYTHWATRPYASGVFLWTGFDYRGEVANSNEIGWQAGVLDSAGTPKDGAYYYKSWWTSAPMIHLLPSWNWAGREGQSINVWCFSNCDEVELLLNGQSVGRQTMKKFGHLEFPVTYQPGTLVARGYRNGALVTTETIQTTGATSQMQLKPFKPTLRADGEDVSFVTVQLSDAAGRMVPDADNALSFSLQGPGKILAVANGDQGSFEPDQFLPSLIPLALTNWKSLPVDSAQNRPETAFDFDDSAWRIDSGRRVGGDPRAASAAAPPTAIVYRGGFEAPTLADGATVTLLMRDRGENQSVYLNGTPIGESLKSSGAGHTLTLDRSILRAGHNVLAIIATLRQGERNERGGASNPALIRIDTPASDWKRSAFNGLAYVMVQSSGQPGDITLTANAAGLPAATLRIPALAALLRPAVPAQ